MRKTLLATVLALSALAAVPALGQTGAGTMTHGAMADGIHATGKINAIKDGAVNVSHDAIPALGWPAMTMDFKLLDGAEIGEIEPGDDAMIILQKGADGLYGIKALMPAN